MVAKRLYRSNRERILGGVAGGLAEYLDLDPTLVRLAWIILGLTAGVGLLAYILAWIIIPEAPWGSRRERRAGSREGDVPPSQATIDVEPVEAHAQAEESPGGPAEASCEGERRGQVSGAWLFGAILILVGLFMLARNFLPFLSLVPWWPLIIIAVGGLILANAFRRGD